MDDLKNRVEDMLNSPVGCEFVLSVVESGLTPEEVGSPLNSFWLAAESEDPDRLLGSSSEARRSTGAAIIS